MRADGSGGTEAKKPASGLCGLDRRAALSCAGSLILVALERRAALRAGLIRIYLVNPVKGLIGEMESDALLSIPRRVDGIPVGQATVEWHE